MTCLRGEREKEVGKGGGRKGRRKGRREGCTRVTANAANGVVFRLSVTREVKLVGGGVVVHDEMHHLGRGTRREGGREGGRVREVAHEAVNTWRDTGDREEEGREGGREGVTCLMGEVARDLV